MNDIDKCSTFIVCHRHLLVKALLRRTTETHGTVSFAVSIHEFSVKGQAEDTVVVPSHAQKHFISQRYRPVYLRVNSRPNRVT